MKFRPILFSTSMVQAILEGRKTQTRRVVRPQPLKLNFSTALPLNELINNLEWLTNKGLNEIRKDANAYVFPKCPYGYVGDVLWVRETWQDYARPDIKDVRFIFKADKTDAIGSIIKWKPSIFMPKKACRIFLKIRDIRVERVQEISEDDAFSGGIKSHEGMCKNYLSKNSDDWFGDITDSFQSLWQSINGERSWSDNPWVWLISFERIEKPENFLL